MSELAPSVDAITTALSKIIQSLEHTTCLHQCVQRGLNSYSYKSAPNDTYLGKTYLCPVTRCSAPCVCNNCFGVLNYVKNQMVDYIDQNSSKITVRRNFPYHRLSKFVRCRNTFGQVPLPPCSFSRPLSFVRWILRCFVGPYSSTICAHLDSIISAVPECVQHIHPWVLDDCIRQLLSAVDSYTFRLGSDRSKSALGASLHGLSNIGGARGSIRSDIDRMVRGWMENRDVKLGAVYNGC